MIPGHSLALLHHNKTFARAQYGPDIEYQSGIQSVFAVLNFTLANLQLSGTSPNRTYMDWQWGEQVSSADPNRKGRARTSSEHDPRKPSIDKDRARLAQSFLDRKDNDTHASESLYSNLDFKLDVQLSSWELPSPSSWQVPFIFLVFLYPMSSSFFIYSFVLVEHAILQLSKKKLGEINVPSLKMSCLDN